MSTVKDVSEFYGKLQGSNAFVGLPEEQEFVQMFDNTQARRGLYEQLRNSGRINGLPDTFEEFSLAFGYNASGDSRSEQKQHNREVAEDNLRAMREDGLIEEAREIKKDAAKSKRQARRHTIAEYISSPKMTGTATGVAQPIGQQIAEQNVENALQDEEYRKSAELYGEERLLHRTMRDALRDAKNVERGVIGQWTAPLAQQIFNVSTWDMGVSEGLDNLTLSALLEKADNGTITESEEMILDTLALANVIQQNADAAKSGVTKVAEALPQSFAFMAQMAANPANGFTRSMAKRAVKKYGVDAMEMGAKELMRNYGGKALARKVGAGLAASVPETAEFVATVGVTRSIADAERKAQGNIQTYVDDNGYIQYAGHTEGEDLPTALLKSFGSTYIESWSEMLGTAAFDPMLSLLKGVKSGKMMSSLADLKKGLNAIKGSEWSVAIKNFKQNAHWDGIINEMLEEEAGMVMSGLFNIENTLNRYNEDGTINENWILDGGNQLRTLLTIALTEGHMKAVEYVGNIGELRKMENNLKIAESDGAKIVGARWGEIQKEIDELNPDGVADYIMSLASDPAITNEMLAAATNYATTLVRWQQYNLATDTQEYDDMSEVMRNAMAAYKAGRQMHIANFRSVQQRADKAYDALAKRDADLLRRADEWLEQQKQTGKLPVAEIETIRNGLSADMSNLLDEYIGAMTARQGIYDNIDDKTYSAMDVFERDLAPVIRDGAVTTATLDGKPVYVLSQENGSAVILSEDAETEHEGKGMMVDASKLKDVTTINAKQLVDAYRYRYATDEQTKADMALNHHPNTQMPVVGMQIDTPSAVDGGATTFIVTNVQPQMGYVELVPGEYSAEQGKVVPKDGAEPIYQTVYTTLQMQDDMYDALDAMNGNAQARTNIPTEQEGESVVENVEQTEEDAPVAIPTEEEDATEETAPIERSQAEIDADDAAELAELGDNDYISSNLDKAKEALDKATKKKPKATEKDARLAEARAIKAEVDALQAEVDRWTAAGQEVARRALQATQIEQAPTSEAAGVGENIQSNWAEVEKIEGNTGSKTLQDGTVIKGRYMLVPASAPTASHDALNGYAPSVGFPTNERGQNINDRDYHNDKAAQAETDRIARVYGGQAVSDTPVVSPEGIVYSGNGRTMASQLAAANGTDTAYMEALRSNAAQFGFTPEQVDSIPNARVVFVTDEVLPYTTETFAKFNQQEKKTQSSTERAVSKSKSLKDTSIARILSIIDSYDTLQSFFGSPKACADMLSVLQQDGVITEAEVAGLTELNSNNETILSATGRDLVTDVVLGATFSEQTLRQMGGDKALKQSVLRALPSIIENRQLKEYALNNELEKAISLLYEARKAKMPLEQFLQTTDMFSGSPTDRYSAFDILVAEQLNESIEAFREVMSLYNNSASTLVGGQAELFGDTLTKEDLQNLILEKYGRTDNRGKENESVSESNSRESQTETAAERRAKYGITAKEDARREPLRERAREVAEKLGANINVIEDKSEVTNEDAKKQMRQHKNSIVKGWFENSTGELFIVLPSMDDLADLEATILHELVAHKGLRNLLGARKFNQLCDAVWDMMTPEQQQEWLAYPGVNGNKRAAADEYIASLAEKMDLSEVEQTTWSKIKQFVLDVLQKLGFRDITENDIQDLIRASYAYMRAGNTNEQTTNEGNRYKVYRSRDGKEVGYTQLSQLSLQFDWGERERDTVSGRNTDVLQREDDATLTTLNTLRELEEGEVCNVERIFTESKEFNFTRGEKIESAADVAYIFKNLEDEAIENAFVALVKDGEVTVIHVGMGGQVMTAVDLTAAIAAADRIKPEKVYLVHNHPSGNLKCSNMDMQLLQGLGLALGDIVQEGIIINTRSGQYGTFQSSIGDVGSFDIPADQDSFPLNIYKFNKQAFKSDISRVEPSSEGIAQFVSTQRLGSRNKINALLLSNNFECLGNVFLTETEITATNVNNVARKLIADATAMGARGIVLYGRSPMVTVDSSSSVVLSEKIELFSDKQIRLFDVIQIFDNGYRRSAMDLGVRFRTTIAPEVREEMESIKADAIANGTFLKAPNGKGTNLNEEQWLMVRTNNFKKWFGDWEKAARIEKLRKSKNASIKGDEIVITDNDKQNKKNAIEYGKTIKDEYINADTGKSVLLTSSKKNGGLYEILQHDYKDKEHLLSIAAIPQIIEKSIYIDTVKNEDKDNHPQILSYDYFLCGLNIGNEEYTVKAVLSNLEDGSRYYDHKLTSIEKGRLIDIINEAPESSVSISTQTPESSAYSDIKDKRLFSILQTNSSKIVDENGEPMVVWHGSSNDFNVFDNEKALKGFYFAPPKRRDSVAGYYAEGKERAFFLNIKNPIEVTPNEKPSDNKLPENNDGWVVRADKEFNHKYYNYRTNKLEEEALEKGDVIEIIAFDPNQIKSATDNNGEFSESGDIRFSVIGEEGAKRDKTEEGITRLANLETARGMEATLNPDWNAKGDETALKIKLATGWERGVDGKWRYETSDFQLRPLDVILSGYGPKTFGDIVTNDELFRIYPELRKIKIRKLTDKKYMSAAYIPEDNTIELPFGVMKELVRRLKDNPDDEMNPVYEKRIKDYLQNAVVHEAQHAIQHIEGFASGGSPDIMTNVSKKTETDKLIDEYNSIVETYNSNKRANAEPEVLEDLEGQLKSIKMQIKDNAKYKIGKDGYMRLAGEVEARNVQNRRGLTDEQKRNALLASTEDIAREDQIILEQAVVDAYSTRFRIVNDLIAVHNLTEDKLRKVFDMGGLIMPSIAITKADMGHEGYGEISLLFDKDTIDPSNRRNKVFGGDAWTPRIPQLMPKLNEKVSARVKSKIRELIDDRALAEIFSLSAELHQDNIERTISERGVNGYYSKEWMKYAYLLDNGKKVKIPMMAKDYGTHSEMILELLKEKGLKASEINKDAYDFYKNNPDVVEDIKNKINEKKANSVSEDQREAVLKVLNERGLSFNFFDALIRSAAGLENDLENGGKKQIIDRGALRETINKKVKTDNADYNKWVDNLFEGIVEKYGIRNKTDWYTPSGNLRSWEKLYDAATPENILRYMLDQNEQGGSGGFWDSNIMGASADTYESIEEIREKGQKRLRRVDSNEYDEWATSVANRFSEISDEFLTPAQRNDFGGIIDAKIAITNAVAKDKTAKGIYKEMKADYPNFTMDHANRVVEIVKEIQDYAIGYFEAKPQRIVPLSEVRKAIVPSNTSEDIVKELKDNGIEVATYRRGNEASRQRLIKKESNGIRFRVANENQEIFVSNAQRAVEGIKQDKATPEQWLAMITKQGGLKAGEDKWLGLSDWLKSSDAKTIAKQEILDFIGENKIKIEEVNYVGGGTDMRNYRDLIAKSRGEEFANKFYKAFDIEYDEFIIDDENLALELYNAENEPHIELDDDGYWKDGDDMQTVLDWAESVNNEAQGNSREINSTRLQYTTEGLNNKREIALTVPTIESWNQGDETHFGDAGGGRAVAWVRFGDTTDSDGNSVLVIDEIQSKRHQEGREKGYNNPRVIEIFKRLADIESNLYSPQGLSMEMQSEREALKAELESVFENDNPVMKSIAEKLDEKRSKRTALLRERLEREDDERVEILKLQAKQDEARNNRDYDYYESEIDKIKERIDQRNEELDLLASDIIDLNLEYSRYYNTEIRNARVGVSPAPFEKNWHELAMKRMLRLAAEEGYDFVAWTTGEQQAERYNIGGVVKRVTSESYGLDDNGDVTRLISITLKGEKDNIRLEVDKNGLVIDGDADYEGKHLNEIVGKEMAVRLMERDIEMSGDNLRIGGEGMKGFYDKMLPSFVSKYTKKWGAKVEDIELPELEETARVMHSVNITPEMKESVMQGQTMFRISERKKQLEKAEKFIEDGLSKGISNGRFFINLPLSTEKMIKNAMGRNFESHSIEIGGIKRGLKNHGVAGRKLTNSSIPITKDDAKLIPYIMVAPDEVKKGTIDTQGRESVKFYKTLSNGYVVVVEKEWVNSTEDLETINIWAEETLSNASLPTKDQPSTSETAYISRSDATKIRKDAELAIEKDVILTESENNLDKEKIQDLIHKQRKTLAEVEYLDLDSVAKVIEDFENPTIESENSEASEDRTMFSVKQRTEADYQDIENRLGIAAAEYERRMDMASVHHMEAWQDSMRSLLEMQRAIEKETGKPILDYENAYMAENRMSSENLAQMEEWKRKFFRPLEGIYKGFIDRGENQFSIRDYLFAKHGMERNEVMARREAQRLYPKDLLQQIAKESELKRTKDYSGLKKLMGKDNIPDAIAEAQKYVQDFEKKHKAEIAKLWDAIRNATQSQLEVQRAAGLLSQEKYEEIKNMYNYYVPLRGFSETTTDEVYDYLDNAPTPYNVPIKTAKGRESVGDDPIANIANMAESGIMQANRNKMKLHFLNMVEQHKTNLVTVSEVIYKYNPVAKIWEPTLPALSPNDTIEETLAKIQQHKNNIAKEMILHPQDYKTENNLKQMGKDVPYKVINKGMLSEHQVLVMREGKQVVMTINGNPRAAQALNGLTNPEVKAEEQHWIQKANRFMAANFTSRNPAFVISNLSRDSIYAVSMVWAKEAPKYARAFMNNMGKVFANMASLMHKYNNGTLDTNVPMEKMFLEFVMNGGQTGYTHLNSVEDYKRQMAKEMKRAAQKKGVRAVTETGRAILNGLENMNKWAENISRFTAYMTSREEGRSISRSISDAKEISVNFNKKGAGNSVAGKFEKGNRLNYLSSQTAQLARGLYVFMNAGIQGMANFGKQAKRHPYKITAMIASSMALGLAAALLSGGGDDEDEYLSLPKYTRRNNLCIKVGDKFVTIPLPIELRAFYGIGELIASRTALGEYYSDAEFAKELAEQLSQLLPIDVLEGGEGFNIKSFIPSAAKPIVDAILNESWTGIPIYNDSEFVKTYPGWKKAYKGTNDKLVDISRWLNEMSGGSDYRQGWMNINPAAIEYIAEQYLGGVGTTVNQFFKMGQTATGAMEFEWRNVPVASRFVNSGNETTQIRAIRSSYYDYREEMDAIGKEFNAYMRDLKKPDLKEEEYQHIEQEIDRIVNSPEYDFYLWWKDINKVINRAKDAGDAEGADELMREAVETYRSWKKGLKE